MFVCQGCELIHTKMIIVVGVMNETKTFLFHTVYESIVVTFTKKKCDADKKN